MPEFLTNEQANRYGRYWEMPNEEQLSRYFHLSERDLTFIGSKKGSHNRLGLALQLGTVRFLGTFLADPLDVPPGIIRHCANQLALKEHAATLDRYREGETKWDHQAAIRLHYGYKDFSHLVERLGLLRFLYARAWLAPERPSILFDLATARLLERKVVLPGFSSLEREVVRVRERVANRLWQQLAGLPSARQKATLEGLLESPIGSRVSTLELLRRGPTSVTANGLLGALKRLEQLQDLGLNSVSLGNVPATRIKALAQYGLNAKAQALRQMTPARRIATLLVSVQHLTALAYDDVLDVFDLLLLMLSNRVDRQGLKARLETLPSLDEAAQTLRQVVVQVIEAEPKRSELNLPDFLDAIFATVSKEHLLKAADAVATLTKSPDQLHAEEMLRRYGYIRQFLPKFLTTISFSATEAGQPILSALQSLLELEGRKKIVASDVVMEVVTKVWHPWVLEGDTINRHAYTLCVLEKLREALRRRNVFVPQSTRWQDPRIKLLSNKMWQEQKNKICLSLGLETDVEKTLELLAAQLDDAYQQVNSGLANNHALTIKANSKSKDQPHLTVNEPQGEGAGLAALRDTIAASLPKVDLPELLLEVNEWTGFTDAFTHISDFSSRSEALATSICAVLVAEACNVGIEPMVKPSQPALTRYRLSWVNQHYLRSETSAAANARLVDHQASLSLAQQWGGGQLASVDGLRFVVPVRTINAAPNPRYFGPGRGVTYLNFVSDQVTGFHGIVVPGTLRDSLYILDGLLEQNTSLEPRQIVSDTHGYTDIVFGLFRLLGYQFSPRLADLSDQRFWRIDKEANYGKLNGLARNIINIKLIKAHWEDMLRVAGSLATGAVKASELMRVLQGAGQPTGLGKAIAEFGRIAKTLHLLTYLDDENYRRKIGQQLNVHENRHNLARVVFHGQKGELRQRYREGQEDQLGALGLVVNAIALWNTRYMSLALEGLKSSGKEVKGEDVQRLSPLGFKHIHMLGRYQFSLPEHVQNGGLRSLRDPESWDED